ncbi:SpvB/TcaC N-terminal domain-containing protein [Weeksellaceae bacterium A-14]
MKSNFYSLLLFFFTLSLWNAQNNSIEVPLLYSTSGYEEKSTSGTGAASKSTTSDVLIPTVNGEMNVNDSGALIYNIPIEVLKGINGFQPNLSLSYNSQSGNGLAGWGWNITGVSVISKGGKSKSVDGITQGPQFNDNDPFYLDGQRLIKLTSTSFITEKFSKLKITKPSSGDYSFIVQYTDGRIAKYKEILSGQYYISTFIDAFNNEIHYAYATENNTARITKISYGTSDKFYIEFIYKNRLKNIQIYRNGNTYINNKYVSEINTGSTYTGLYRKYSLSFDYIEDGSIERLRTVTVNNGSGDSLKPLNFSYNQSTQGGATINFPTSQLASGKLDYGVTGLGSAVIGNFKDIYNTTPIYQVRKGNTYSIPGLVNIENNSGTLLFSGKVLDLNNKVTLYDQVIVVNEKYPGVSNSEVSSAAENQNLVDNIVFEIRDLSGNTGRKVTVPVKGGVFAIQNYVPADPYDNPYGESYETYERDQTRREFVQGDFNNDGLVDFLIVESLST